MSSEGQAWGVLFQVLGTGWYKASHLSALKLESIQAGVSEASSKVSPDPHPPTPRSTSPGHPPTSQKPQASFIAIGIRSVPTVPKGLLELGDAMGIL